jgi:hypothetical protein
MINVHRLLALSSTAVVVAACSGGGGSATVAPHPAASAAGTTPAQTAHAPNATLTLTFPKNYIRFKHVRTPNALRRKKVANAARKSALKSMKASSAKRGTKFIDPSNDTELQIEVSNSNNTGYSSYMAAIDVPIVSSQTNTQTIPIYLAPGYDTVLVQETFAYLGGIQEYEGYLLAQGTVNIGVSEGSRTQVNVTMQMVMSEAFVSTDPTSGYASGMTTASGPTYAALCVNDNQAVYFVPGDWDSGTYVYGENPGDVAPSDGGIPFASVNVVPNFGATVFPGTRSTAVQNPFGGYTVQFDANNDPITFSATYSAVQNPYFGPFPDLGAGSNTYQVPSSTETYYALIAPENSSYCQDY